MTIFFPESLLATTAVELELALILPLAALVPAGAALDPAAAALEVALAAVEAAEEEAVSEELAAAELVDPEGTGPEVPPTGDPEGVTEFATLAAADENADSVSVDYEIRI